MDAPWWRSDILLALDIVFWRRGLAVRQMCSPQPSSARVGHESGMAKAGRVICRARTSLFANPVFPSLYSGLAPTGGPPGRCSSVIEANAPIQAPNAGEAT